MNPDDPIVFRMITFMLWNKEVDQMVRSEAPNEDYTIFYLAPRGYPAVRLLIFRNHKKACEFILQHGDHIKETIDYQTLLPTLTNE